MEGTGVFTKAVLRPGRYRSPNGVIDVTPERLRHWETQFRQVHAAGYTIPMHWDHSADPASMEPVRMGSVRSAANTVGRLRDFRVATDGLSAELTVQTLTQSATEKAAANAVYVSPVLFSQWQDGGGRTYTDLIGSVDLVDLPVDHSQGPFVPVQAMTTASKGCVIRMSTAPESIYQLSEPKAVDDEEQKTEEPTEQPDTETAPVEDPPRTADTNLLTDVLAGLTKVGLVLPTDTTGENLLERLHTAILTATGGDGQTTDPGDPNPTPVDPAIATMSTRINALEGRILNDERTKLGSRLDALLESGRCTPAEHRTQKAQLAVQRMSLAADHSVHTGDPGKWLESRESIPVGACWDPAEKVKRMSATPVKAPEQWAGKPPEDVDELRRQKKEMLRR